MIAGWGSCEYEPNCAVRELPLPVQCESCVPTFWRPVKYPCSALPRLGPNWQLKMAYCVELDSGIYGSRVVAYIVKSGVILVFELASRLRGECR